MAVLPMICDLAVAAFDLVNCFLSVTQVVSVVKSHISHHGI